MMGCVCTRDEEKDNKIDITPQKQYSWDKRKECNINPKDFIIENLDNEEALRVPGSINGQQFIIQNCKSSTIYVLDHMNTVTIDDCTSCNIVLGPVKGSVFLRNCKSCTCVTACGQFRTRDSRKLHVFLYCATQPIIEASTSIHFGQYELSYDELPSHLEQAGLDVSRMMWEEVHDFTPLEVENNWSFLAEGRGVGEFVPAGGLEERLRTFGVRWRVPEPGVKEVVEPIIAMETTL